MGTGELEARATPPERRPAAQLPLAFAPEGSTRPTTPLGVCLVTGGAGYLGRFLAEELVRRGHAVRVFDLRAPLPAIAGAEVVVGDVTRSEDVRAACAGVDTIFHTAAVLDCARWPSAALRERSVAVNVRGVENVVRAALEAGVQRLVHTSTNDVTAGEPVIAGDERDPYSARPRDLYTETKIAGERAALGANCAALATCAIRPGAVYGPGEPAIFVELARALASGRYLATFGDPEALADNSYVLDLVDAEIEAARHLLPGSPLAGQAYLVTDGRPINYWEFFRRAIDAIGARQARLRLPIGPVYGFFTAWELAHAKLGAPPSPASSLAVRKMAISHYSRIDRAKRDFGWAPRTAPDDALAACVPSLKRLLAEVEVVDRPHAAWWVAVLGGMSLTGALALSGTAYALFAAHVTPWLPRSAITAVFVWACWLHVRKGLRAVQLAERAGLSDTALGWGWQTFLLGFASLALLEKRIARRAAPATARAAEPETERA